MKTIHTEILDEAMEDMNNAEFDTFDNVASNAEHINQQDCTVETIMPYS